MVRRLWPGLALAVVLLIFPPLVGMAQDYRFDIPDFTCNVSVEKDQSAIIYYEIRFHCAPGAHPIDIVDIGFPTSDYQLSSVRAEIDGSPVTDIRRSEVLPIGVEIHLGDRAIAPGSTAVLKASGVNPHMVFQDKKSPDDASFQFSPTWFDGRFLTGQSHFVLQIQFPPGATSETVRYHQTPFTSARVSPEGRVIYTWETTRAVKNAFPVGISFPASLVEGSLAVTPPSSAGKRSGGGVDIGALVAVGLFGGFFTLIIVIAVIAQKKRRLKYLPPSMGVEGVGIKRGLTAPLAGLLLEEKLDRVLTLVLFGLLRKEAITVTTAKGKTILQKNEGINEAELWDYEKDFLAALNTRGDLNKTKLKTMFVDMIRALNKRMAGFSRKETQAYYRSIVAKAWDQVKQAGTDETAARTIENQIPWLMMDRRFNERLPELPPVIMTWVPGWYIPHGTSAGAGPATPGPTLPEFCHQVASSIENMAQGVVSSFESLTGSVTAVTNPIPQSSHSSGGSGCACACACAGCACACAGGGR